MKCVCAPQAAFGRGRKELLERADSLWKEPLEGAGSLWKGQEGAFGRSLWKKLEVFGKVRKEPLEGAGGLWKGQAAFGESGQPLEGAGRSLWKGLEAFEKGRKPLEGAGRSLWKGQAAQGEVLQQDPIPAAGKGSAVHHCRLSDFGGILFMGK